MSTLNPIRENAPNLEKCVQPGKMRHARKNTTILEKCATLGKMGQTCNNAPHLEKCATLEKVRHTWKNTLFSVFTRQVIKTKNRNHSMTKIKNLGYDR